MKSTIHEYKKINVLNTSKKTIIILGLALGAFANQSFASNVKLSQKSETVYFVDSPICNAIIKGDLEAVKKFIEYGVDVNQASNGVTPLMLAARYNKSEIIDLLLKNGADKKTKDERGYTALKYAELSKASEAIAALK
ncbi:ankyrin repeat domain-containing protein [Flavobacterium amnicola]|uniref:Ankyrin repeat domain-containing protein n=1 Tax=Flavobacterium amnicola TaxID=2506422 RepID=A0A4Q1K392_9FLAO|nr:ankyrin repeat domain-containing protein [Flavobacterium amnicola]RXR18449.1 ankyrin repeat domain-containing protein [Flavobacterium amnicola]